MIEVISVKGNSVRIRSGIFVVDVPVIERNGKNILDIPKHPFFITDQDYRKLVAVVLNAFDKSRVKAKSSEQTDIRDS